MITKQCTICETTLEMEVDGQAMRFTAHTDDFCKTAALMKIRLLEASVHRTVLEMTGLREQLEICIRATHRYERGLEEADEELGRIRTRMINGERPLSAELEHLSRTITLAREPERPRDPGAQGAQLDLAQLDVLAGRAYTPARPVRETSPPPAPEPRPDLHHSQGVHITEILAEEAHKPSKA